MENKYVEFAKLVALFLAVVLPVPVIGYIIHTPASITVSYLSFVIIGLVFPFFWYMTQKKDLDRNTEPIGQWYMLSCGLHVFRC